MSADVVTFLGMVMDRRTRWNFFCEATNAALFGVFIGVVGPFALPLAIRMGADSLQVGLIASAPFIANLFSPVWAQLSRGGRQLPWVVIPHLIWRGGYGLLGLITQPVAFVALVLGANLTVAAGNPAYGALCQKCYPAPVRGRLMGYVRLLLAGVMLPTTLAAGMWIDRSSPALLFLVAGGFGLAAIAAYSFTREPMEAGSGPGPVHRPSIVAGFRIALADAAFRRFVLAALLFHGGVLMALPLYSVYQVKQMGLSNAQIGFLAIAWNLAFLAAFAVWGRLVDRKGAGYVVIGAALFYLGQPLAYALGGGVLAILMLGALCQGIADAGLDLGGWNVILSANPDRVGVYTSTHMTMIGIRGALAPLLGTWLFKALGFAPTFLISAALVAAGLMLLVSGRVLSHTPPKGLSVS